MTTFGAALAAIYCTYWLYCLVTGLGRAWRSGLDLAAQARGEGPGVLVASALRIARSVALGIGEVLVVCLVALGFGLFFSSFL